MRSAVTALEGAGTLAFGDPEHVEVAGGDDRRGAFLSLLLLRCTDAARPEPHQVEAFGPVAVVIGYDGTAAGAAGLLRRGEGSLAGSVVTADPEFARDVALGAAAAHGRMLVLDRDCAAESTGHGTPLPQLAARRPGPADGGEEEGGLRAVRHHLQRTAVQGSPALLGVITR